MSEKISMSNDKRDEQPTLSDFIENNYRILTSLGIFTALTAFSLNLPFKYVGQFLAFLFMTLAFIVWIELWTKIPAKANKGRIYWFAITLNIAVIFIAFYWVIQYYAIFNSTALLTFLIVIAFNGYILQKLRLSEHLLRIKAKIPNTLGFVMSLIIGVALMFISAKIAAFITRPIDIGINAVIRELQKPTPTNILKK